MSVAAGITVGLMPCPGITAVVAAAVALVGKLNMIAIQTAQLMVAPLQLLLIVPLIRGGPTYACPFHAREAPTAVYSVWDF